MAHDVFKSVGDFWYLLLVAVAVTGLCVAVIMTVSRRRRRRAAVQGPAVALDYAVITHQGGRQQNQDSCIYVDGRARGRHIFVLADGLGGHRGGEEASRIAVNHVADALSEIEPMDNYRPALFDAMVGAHDEIRRQAAEDPDLNEMKTTCVCLLIVGGYAYWASVGDSRLYFIRNGEILGRTRDHSVVQLLVDSGEVRREDAAHHPDRNRLFQALGIDKDVVPDINADGVDLLPGDYFLLCSDGFWEYLSDEALKAYVRQAGGTPAKRTLDTMFDQIVAVAMNDNPRHDNMTAQLVVIRS